MKELQKKIKTILEEIENKYKNEDDALFAKTKVLELYDVFADELENLENEWSDKVDIIATKHALLESKVQEVQNALNKIKSYIYVDDDEYDLDITCPYCNAEITIDTSDELQSEVTCPECNNVIELDWNDEECGHDCSGCHHDCDHEHDDEDEDEDM